MALSKRDTHMAALIVAAIALGGAYYNYVYSPKNAELATIETRLTSLDQQNNRAKQELARGGAEEMRAQARIFEENLRVMRQLVPLANEVPALLEQVSTAARRVGLDVAQVQPQPVIVGEEFDTYRYSMGVAGSYHQVAEFLTNIGNLTRIVEPIKLEMKEMTNAQAARSRQRPGVAALDVAFDIQTYVAKGSAGRGAQ